MRNVWTITVLEFWFFHQKCHFLGLKDGHFWQKWPFSDHKKWHFQWPNQNSKTTFIVQTFPKFGPYDFYFVNLSLLGAIWAIFQFCLFYIEMHNTSFDFVHFLLWWSYSTRPIEYNDSFNIFSSKQKLQQAINSRSNFCLLANDEK